MAMGSESASQIGRSSAAASTDYGTSSEQSTIGKQSLAGQQSVEAANPLVERVKARAGTELLDGGGFGYVVTPEGAFRIIAAPPTNVKSIGVVITMTGPYASAWYTLVDILDRTGDGQCVEPPQTSAPDQSIGQPEPAKPTAPKQETPKQDANDPAPAPVDTSGGDLYWIVTANCKVKTEKGANAKPEQLIPQYTHVRVLEKKQFSSFTNAKIALVDGTEIGWASFQHMLPLRRPARPSTAAAQMAAVLGAARAVAGTKPHGRCYANVKKHILNGGGYGDILDIQTDERFMGHLASAVMFHDAVQQHGAAALGLEMLGGLPMQAAPGTILILRGTGKNHISEEHGDISVIDNVSGGVVHCLNDGHMKLLAKESDWSGEGKMTGSVVAMYRPIDRQ
jgi:hypothetical protein